MLIRFVRADRGFPQSKMWEYISNYWAHALVGFIAWCVIVYFSLKIIEEFKSRRQKRRYRQEDDIGRKRQDPGAEGESGGFQPRVRISKTRKRKLQESVEHAKRELLSGGASGGGSEIGGADKGSKQDPNGDP